MLQSALKTPLNQAFGELSTMGKIGGVLSVVTGAAGAYFEKKRPAKSGSNPWLAPLSMTGFKRS